MFDNADKFLKIAIGLGALTAGAGVGYHYGVYLPKIERDRLEAAANATIARQKNYAACLEAAEQAHLLRWETTCMSSGQKEKDCPLEVFPADRLLDQKEAAEKVCLEKFSGGL